MNSVRSRLSAMPVIRRFTLVGLAAAGVLGGVVGLVVGLYAYPPTAWFAVLEVGVPAAIVGGALGAVVGLVTVAGQRARYR
jgi:hypothetical protein